MPLFLRRAAIFRPSGHWADYDIVSGGLVIGRVMKTGVAGNVTVWRWYLHAIHAPVTGEVRLSGMRPISSKRRPLLPRIGANGWRWPDSMKSISGFRRRATTSASPPGPPARLAEPRADCGGKVCALRGRIGCAVRPYVVSFVAAMRFAKGRIVGAATARSLRPPRGGPILAFLRAHPASAGRTIPGGWPSRVLA
jgi:hypothetical protein